LWFWDIITGVDIEKIGMFQALAARETLVGIIFQEITYAVDEGNGDSALKQGV
jgi:hypothetical protein